MDGLLSYEREMEPLTLYAKQSASNHYVTCVLMLFNTSASTIPPLIKNADEPSTSKRPPYPHIRFQQGLSAEARQLNMSRYVETMTNLADACNGAVNQGRVSRVRLQLFPAKSHLEIADIITSCYRSECVLHFHNEDTDFTHLSVLHENSRECEECYDMFHTLLGLDLQTVGHH
ncbi:hypothetical protein KIN20_037936 [Parelaphostrongylus tenuis]|uniref:Uncharacterized protein n=1 Tax=Parelaphostrongylus tenuis TaxID=148309 RepID=A0AAD5RI88_PARTN|nr:hypothetical protein KIN20_037936 [Parelaphostrongylus tenuis]